ncbi:hypothetical protein MLD38_019185 [Melastoma candidum]|uniref:Uncharacterized protein n=1 Tax=Melastoma candidum TaxID=119954 RepID=A0ACB9QW43_9MYRT|nr:hypothetical protein MLD38_019185 [Melastoma candidum]
MAVLVEEMIKSVEMWLRMIRQKPQPYVNPDLDPVLLVPGIAGSVLHSVDVSTNREERVWVRIFQADYKFRTKLWSRFDPSTGKSVSLDPNSHIVVPEDRHGLQAIDVLDPDMVIGRECVYYFHDMIVEMIRWGFEEGKTLFGFGYDFRQSNRFSETMERLAAKLELVYKESGGKKINIITHSMGGLLVKCFMCLHSEIFEKYVKSWIAIAAPFRGAPGYVTSTFLNGMSFVDGWEQNFFISKWNVHQLLIECPSIYELMACPYFDWQNNPALQIWREKIGCKGDSNVILESFSPTQSIDIFAEALSCNTVDYNGECISLPFNEEILKWAHETRKILSSAKVPPGVKFYNIYGTSLETPHSVCYGNEAMPVKDLQELQYFLPTYYCVDGDGTVPVESAQADGLEAEARVGVPGEHRGILSDHHLFRMLKHWLNADSDPFYNPLNDYVILPTTFEMDTCREKGMEVTSLKEEWEIITAEGEESKGGQFKAIKPSINTISVSQIGSDAQHMQAEARATLIVHPENEEATGPALVHWYTFIDLAHTI